MCILFCSIASYRLNATFQLLTCLKEGKKSTKNTTNAQFYS